MALSSFVALFYWPSRHLHLFTIFPTLTIHSEEAELSHAKCFILHDIFMMWFSHRFAVGILQAYVLPMGHSIFSLYPLWKAPIFEKKIHGITYGCEVPNPWREVWNNVVNRITVLGEVWNKKVAKSHCLLFQRHCYLEEVAKINVS